ncbi:MAG TPA: MFS transporter, partial [Solirubrobacterales bacterium]|nr:MFS transporter [Solirubrobacterales bacterium]
DVSIVNVALPSIKDALGFSTTGLQWVLNAYTLTFAGFLLLGGRAADLFGRRRMFYLGTLLFSGASLLCAIAPSSGALVAARAAQGIGGAILSPATLAIITTSFDEGAPRNRALGAWGAVGAIGATSGVLLGGILTEAFSWPAIFVINVPIGLAIVLFSSRLIPEGRSEVENRHFDLAGALLVTLGMTALTYGIVTTDRLGWGSIGVLGPVVTGVALLVAFGLYEARLAGDPRRVPLMPLSAFRLRNLRAANLVIFLLYAAIFGFWFFQSLYMQGTLGYSALETGLAFVPMTAAVGAGATLAPRLAKRFGARWVLAAGMLSATIGELLLISVHPGGSYAANVLPGGLLGAFGLGLALVPATIVAVEGVPRALSGLASGVLNTSRFVGAALGLAVLSTIAAHHTDSEIASGTSTAKALTDGFDLQFAVGAAFCFIGVIAAVALLRPQRAEVAPENVRGAERA